jgi:hypothetical protein
MNPQSSFWPNFYVVGAPKCGTTSVWAYLRKHPQVFLPSNKEPSFFLTTPLSTSPDCCTGNLEAYRGLYRNANGYKAVGDASACYLWDPNVAARIHDVCPDARIVILLRDPVERAFSHYVMLVRAGAESQSFAEVVKQGKRELLEGNWPGTIRRGCIESGLYSAQVRRYLETFGREQVGIFLFEDLVEDPAGLMSAICGHIGVDAAQLDMKQLARVHNEGRIPRAAWLHRALKTALSPDVRRRAIPRLVRKWLKNSPLLFKRYTVPQDEETTKSLQAVYGPDLRCLEDLLGRKLPQLRKNWV